MATLLKSSPKSKQRGRIKEIPLDFAVRFIGLVNANPVFNDKPLYDLTEENISKLRELIDIPFASFDGIKKYQTLEEKAAVIFCATIRGHKFGNGNKRTGSITITGFAFC